MGLTDVDVPPEHHTVRVLEPDPRSREPMPIDVPEPLVVVMRDDTAHVAGELDARLPRRGPAPAARRSAAIHAAYRRFRQDVQHAMRRLIVRPHGVRFHLVDAVSLEQGVRHRAGGNRLVSLDPLVPRVDATLDLSRGFLLGGRHPVGLVGRPGARPVDQQLVRLRRSWSGSDCVLVEDDVYTGGTVASAIRLLGTAELRVTRVVPGIRLAATADRTVAGVPLDPVIEYRVPYGPDVAAPVDVADPRNFLLGVSGLVVRLPGGGWGRAPYWLPFVSASARASIDARNDRAFAMAMLDANARFYAAVERATGCLVRVTHLHPSVRSLLAALEIALASTPVRTVIDRLRAHLDHYVELVRWLERRQLRAATTR